MTTTTSTWRRRANTLLAGFAFFVAGAATEARASIVDPAVLLDGNPTCTGGTGQLGLGYESEIKIEPVPEVGTTTVRNIVVGGSTVGTVSVTRITGGISWTSTYPLEAAFLKGGSGGHLYPYVLPPNSAAFPYIAWAAREPVPGYPGSLKADTNLFFPQGSSHISFCYDNDEPIVTPPEITKTADASWTRYHDWTLDKAADPTSIEMFNGDSHDVDYTVTATKTPWGAFTVSGVITISDPLDQGFSVDTVADSIIFGADVTNTPFHPDLTCANVNDATDVIHRCTYTITLSSKAYAFLAAGGTGVNSAVAGVSLDGTAYEIGPATANFTFPADPAASFGDTLSLDDTMYPGAPDHTFTDSGVFEYTHTFVCADDEGENDNTATGTFSTGPSTNGTVTATETVVVDCHDVTVRKTALTRFSRDFDWSPEKKIVVRPIDLTSEEKSEHCTLLASGPYAGNYLCDDITIHLPTGGVYDTVYSVTATKDGGTDSGFQVYGVITVSWPADAPEPVFTGDPTDVLGYVSGLPASVNATVSNCVADTDQITCDYVADVPDDRSGTNTASIVRPYVCHASDGSARTCAVPGSSTYSGAQGFIFGAPEAVSDNCIAMSDLFNGTPGLNLGPAYPEFTVADPVCASGTFYLTGEPVPGTFLDIFADWAPVGFEEFDPQCTFYVPNLLNLSLDDGLVRSDEAVISVFLPDACHQGCTLTQGYWKTHAIYAPKPQFARKRDATWDMVGAQAENTTFFLSGKSWIDVFWTAPKGNAYYNLAHQYMAAKLNIYAGASTTTAVDAAIASAETWFAAYPPSSGFWKSNKAAVISAAGVLGSFNEGGIGPGHCSEAPIAR